MHTKKKISSLTLNPKIIIILQFKWQKKITKNLILNSVIDK